MSLTNLVRPGDPVVGSVLDGLSAAATATDVIQAVAAAVAGWRTDPRPGPAPDYSSFVAARAANCINLATLVCACLRGAGTRHAYVLMGSSLGTFPVGAHAWVVYREAADAPACRISPPSLCVEPADAGWIRSVDPVAAWNDADIAVGRQVLPTLVRALRIKEET